MKSSTQIAHGGGWLTRQTIGRPKARFFGVLSVIWLGVSLCASLPFWSGWPQSFGYLEWLCGGLIIPLPIFIGLALFFAVTEQPRTIIKQCPNADHDLRKLY
jgi:ATP/ADP translocase